MSIGKAIDDIIASLKGFEVEDQNAILSAVCTHLKLSNPVSAAPIAPTLGAVASTATKKSPTFDIDIRALAEQRKPANAVQMACLVAYYLQEHAPEGERKDTVSTVDLDKYFKQAKFIKMPNDIGSVLPNAKKSGYLDSAVARGEYKLTAVGYNLIVHNLAQNT